MVHHREHAGEAAAGGAHQPAVRILERSVQVGEAWMPILCSIDTQLTPSAIGCFCLVFFFFFFLTVTYVLLEIRQLLYIACPASGLQIFHVRVDERDISKTKSFRVMPIHIFKDEVIIKIYIEGEIVHAE